MARLALVSSLDARAEVLDAGGDEAQGGHDPARMFLLSLAVPGSGQIVQGEKRGWLYLVAELAFWGGFYALNEAGLGERDDYERFADEHWDFDGYSAWYQDNCVDCGDDCAGDYDCRPLAEYGTQEYYEDIGKYGTYWRWWHFDGDEWDIVWDGYSAEDVSFRDEYWGMRQESNRHLRQARYFMMAAFLNHVVSAVDSFLSARSGGAESAVAAPDVALEFDVPEGREGLSCTLVARY